MSGLGRPGQGKPGLGQKQPPISIKSLSAEAQRVHEILGALSDARDADARKALFESVGLKEPIGPQSYAKIAEHYAAIGIPLTPQGIARFKADRDLSGGSAIGAPIAKALVRALRGREVLVRLERQEELNLRPSDRATLQFMRKWAAHRTGYDGVTRLKAALGLGNPSLPDKAAALENCFVGLHTIREVSKVSAQRGFPLNPSGMAAMCDALEAEAAEAGTSG